MRGVGAGTVFWIIGGIYLVGLVIHFWVVFAVILGVMLVVMAGQVHSESRSKRYKARAMAASRRSSPAQYSNRR